MPHSPLLLQLVLILGTARLLSLLLERLGQPPVVGEMTAGIVLGGAAGARIAGYPWRTAFAVGSLMNARALMELIVMKVGLDAGVIGRDLFTGRGQDQVPDARDTVARP
jgi:Kef-type K+ transport system membrane component KefB